MAFAHWEPSLTHKFLIHQRDRKRNNDYSSHPGPALVRSQCRFRDIGGRAWNLSGVAARLRPHWREAARAVQSSMSCLTGVDEAGKRDHWSHRHSASIKQIT